MEKYNALPNKGKKVTKKNELTFARFDKAGDFQISAIVIK